MGMKKKCPETSCSSNISISISSSSSVLLLIMDQKQTCKQAFIIDPRWSVCFLCGRSVISDSVDWRRKNQITFTIDSVVTHFFGPKVTAVPTNETHYISFSFMNGTSIRLKYLISKITCTNTHVSRIGHCGIVKVLMTRFLKWCVIIRDVRPILSANISSVM